MVCTTLTVTATPVVTVVANTTGFTRETNCSTILDTDCRVPIAEVTGKLLRVIVNIKVENAKAKFRINFNYKLGTVDKGWYYADQTQVVGTQTWCLATTDNYVEGSYTGLVVTVQDVVAA